MNILFVNASLTQGGSERAMALVANQMAALGHDVTMLLVREKKVTYSVGPRVKVIQLTYPSNAKLSILRYRLSLIRRYSRELSPDCIVSFMWDLNVTVLSATLGLSARKVVSERALPGSGDRLFIAAPLERLFYTSADAIVYQTQGAMECCPERLRPKACVIPNIVARPTLDPWFGERSKRIVSAGRLSAQKNFPMLLRAFATFSAEHPGYTLEVYGDGELREELLALADELGISALFNLPGYVEDVAARINDAAMFVLPSNYEGISNAMAEALALGVPTICTDCPVGGASLMIKDGVNGLLVPVGDSASLALAMGRIADDPSFSSALSSESQRVVEEFSADKIGMLWEGVIGGASC